MSPGQDLDAAVMLDNFFDWIGIRWRTVVYSFFAGILFSVACATCSAAYAADYTQPLGAPTIEVPNHGVVVSVFAVSSVIGEGIGVFEKSGTGGWRLCGSCLISPETPNMESEVKLAGGPGPYIEAKREALNAVMALRYPAVMPPPSGSALSMVNSILASGNTLRLVNGVPVLGQR